MRRSLSHSERGWHLNSGGIVCRRAVPKLHTAENPRNYAGGDEYWATDELFDEMPGQKLKLIKVFDSVFSV